MILLLFLLGLALGAEARSDDQGVKLQNGSCPLFWFGFNGRCYRYVATRLTWAEAELNCVSQGGNLVSIHSLEEHSFVRNLIKNFDPSHSWTWIGLSDLHRESRWMWSDGCAVNFQFWDRGQPNNHKHKHCGGLNRFSLLKWIDVKCAHSLPSVCASRITCP
ncbi:uncharacterized protein V6R79_006640 [Siganus canaliculatus]